MASITLRPTSGSGSSWSSIANAYDTSTSTAATVSAKSNTYTNMIATFNFDISVIPTNATINSATLNVMYKQSSSTSSRRYTPYIDINGSSSNRVISSQLTSTSTVTNTANIVSYISTLSTITITPYRAGTSGSNTLSVYDIYIEVDYTEPVTTYTVTFKDWNGTVLDTQTVSEGDSATAPTAPVRDGYTFTGWSGNYTNVTSNVTITAQYQQNEEPPSGGDSGDSDIVTIATNLNSANRWLYTVNVDWDTQYIKLSNVNIDAGSTSFFIWSDTSYYTHHVSRNSSNSVIIGFENIDPEDDDTNSNYAEFVRYVQNFDITIYKDHAELHNIISGDKISIDISTELTDSSPIYIGSYNDAGVTGETGRVSTIDSIEVFTTSGSVGSGSEVICTYVSFVKKTDGSSPFSITTDEITSAVSQKDGTCFSRPWSSVASTFSSTFETVNEISTDNLESATLEFYYALPTTSSMNINVNNQSIYTFEPTGSGDLTSATNTAYIDVTNYINGGKFEFDLICNHDTTDQYYLLCLDYIYLNLTYSEVNEEPEIPEGELVTKTEALRPNSVTQDSGYNNTWTNPANTYDTDTSTSGTIIVTGSSQSGFKRKYVDTVFNFDTSHIPADATINSATLTIRAKQSATTNLNMTASINGNDVIASTLLSSSTVNYTADVKDYVKGLEQLNVNLTSAATSNRTFTLYDVRIDVDYSYYEVSEEPDQPTIPADHNSLTIICNEDWGYVVETNTGITYTGTNIVITTYYADDIDVRIYANEGYEIVSVYDPSFGMLDEGPFASYPYGAGASVDQTPDHFTLEVTYAKKDSGSEEGEETTHLSKFHLGNVIVDKLYLGSGQINNIYIGETLLYSISSGNK